GLPYGYLKTDFNANNSDNGSELYEAAYHLDIDSYSIKAGHFEFEPEVNSTDFLNNTARVAQNSLTVGTSKKLLVGGHNNDKVLSFYAPTSGGVQVLRDGRLIFQDNVPEGQNSIPYSKLPSGRYEAVLEVTSGGQVVNTQTYQVYNTKGDSLTQGEVDFVATAGMFSGSHYDYTEHGIQNIEDDVYGKA
ncbi:TcfC E-set like domain-containing protein, partial [Vibrio splendidus]